MRLYLDACPVIYLVQEAQPWFPTVDRRVRQPGVKLVVSDLTRMECHVKPLREANAKVLRDFDEFFRDVVSEVVSLSRTAVDRATEIRAAHGFKTPDALHLGAALVSECDAFLTNDHQLDGFPDLEVKVVEDL